jgi:hypothetical protein
MAFQPFYVFAFLADFCSVYDDSSRIVHFLERSPYTAQRQTVSCQRPPKGRGGGFDECHYE